MKKPGTTTRRNGTVRCAIYTRKSSEEGLEQEFNSLQAQREACEAFIDSQRHEGWVCLRAAYDDGGFSGATMDRPALQQLLADVKAGRVDTIVVYKIDRLTRSLADFAKIVEILDARSASFVSVTQQFNTTTSMGRLTLNVLLSFAQFEREVIGERIRDKIAASKKKGMWMGGVPPLGYQAQDRKLVIVESEAEIVRFIFRRYAELGSVRWLRDELEARSIQSKLRTSASGGISGGKPFARGALYLMLQNRIYRGEIVHNRQSYPGEHEPIIDQPLWDAVQAQLAGNAAERNDCGKTRQPSLLAGMLFDGDGNRMTPSHAVKKGTRYRYYVSRSLITKDRTDDSAGLRIPAAEIEQLVSDRVHRWLLDPGSIYKSTSARLADASIQQRLVARTAEIGKRWPELPVARKRAVLTALIERIEVSVDQIDIRLRPSRLSALLDAAATPSQGATDDETEILSRAGTAAPRRAGDQNGDRRHRSVCRETGCEIDQAAPQGAPVQRDTRRQRRHSLCCTRPAGRCQPVLFHASRPPQLSRAGYHPSDPRWAAAARFDGREAPRALPSAACLARSADRARLCLSSDPN